MKLADNMINYGKVVDEAMHIIVYKVLKMVEKEGLPGDHHFFISFATQNPKVKLSKNLLKKYPKEMTIVLQYQYVGLKISKSGLDVTLSFNGLQENIYVPFSSITTFADPSVQFGLQFREVNYDYEEINLNGIDDIDDDYTVDMESDYNNFHEENDANECDKKLKSSKKGKEKGNVVSLDNFRKKNPNT